MKIDNNLKFSEHIENFQCVTDSKLHSLLRVRKYLSREKAWVLCNVLINSQFNHATINWLF